MNGYASVGSVLELRRYRTAYAGAASWDNMHAEIRGAMSVTQIPDRARWSDIETVYEDADDIVPGARVKICRVEVLAR